MIRTLKQTDYNVTKHLFNDVFDMSEFPHFVDAWASRDDSPSFWIGGALVGAAIVGANKLNYIFIHDDYRDHGIGTKLLNAVIAAYPTIYLQSVDDPNVKKWYVKNGFRQSVDCVYVRHEHNLRPR
jgi:GNAT superfamily N-acetyltransferase